MIIALFFILLASSMLTAGLGYKRPAEIIFGLTFITAIAYAIHLMTTTINIQL